MIKEQLFWMAVIVLLNIVAYLVGRRDGKIKGYNTTVTLFKAIAPEEMAIIREKFDKIDPWKFAFEYVQKERAERK